MSAAFDRALRTIRELPAARAYFAAMATTGGGGGETRGQLTDAQLVAYQRFWPAAQHEREAWWAENAQRVRAECAAEWWTSLTPAQRAAERAWFGDIREVA